VAGEAGGGRTRAGGRRPRALQAGEQLHIGDTVETEGDSSITLEFADASRLQLREYSRLRLDQLSRYGHTGMVDTRLRLQQGRASNRVTPARGPASRYIIDAPTATSSVRGTVFRVSAGDDAHAGATEVLEGKVQVGNPHGQRLVHPGQASRSAGSGTAPEAVSGLLPAPRLRADATRLGNRYAALFPERVARMVLVNAQQPESAAPHVEQLRLKETTKQDASSCINRWVGDFLVFGKQPPPSTRCLDSGNGE